MRRGKITASDDDARATHALGLAVILSTEPGVMIEDGNVVSGCVRWRVGW